MQEVLLEKMQKIWIYLDVVNKTAHKIKPSIDYIGVTELRNDLRTLEAIGKWSEDSKILCTQLIANLKLLLKELKKAI